MAAEAHVKELENKHAKLDSIIKDQMKSPAADPIEIAALKKKKLLLKDQIAALS